jgi:hypothetical protein
MEQARSVHRSKVGIQGESPQALLAAIVVVRGAGTTFGPYGVSVSSRWVYLMLGSPGWGM